MYRKILLVPLTVSILCLMVASSYSGLFDNAAGTSGAQFMRISPGARPAAMGGAFTAVTDDANALSYNPASIAFMPQKEITFTHNEWLQGIRYEYVAVALPLNDSMAIGGSFFFLNAGEIAYRDNEGSLVDEGTYGASDMAATISYSQKLTGKLSVGISGRILSMTIENESAEAYQADVGIIVKLAQTLNIGFSLQNFGQEIKFINEADPSPMNFRSGIAFRTMDGLLTVAADINFMTLDTFVLNTGSEFRIQNYSIRAGYQMVPSQDAFSSLSFGGGLIFDNASIDYGWLMYGALGSTHRISISFKF